MDIKKAKAVVLWTVLYVSLVVFSNLGSLRVILLAGLSMDAGTLLMHEGVHKDDPQQFTRPWFAWANSIFSEFVEKAVDDL